MRKIDILRGKIEKLVGLLTQQNIKVTQSGAEAYTLFDDKTKKPKTINIPQIPDNASDDLLAAIEGYVDHEVGHALFTDFESLAESKTDKNLSCFMNMVEDSRVERKMIEKFSGSAYNLSKTAELFEKESIDPVLKNGQSVSVYGALICPAIRAWAGCHQFVDYMEDKWSLIPEIVSKIGDYAKAELPKLETTADSLRASRKILELLHSNEDKKEKPQPQPQPQGDEERKKSGGEGKSDEKEQEKTEKGQQEQQESDGQSEDKKSGNGKRRDKVEKMLSKMKDRDVFSEAISDALESRIKALENSSEYRVFSTDFDVIKPVKIPKDFSGDIEKFEGGVRNIVGVVQKKLERAISAKSLGYWVGGHKSGKLKSSSLTRFIVKNDDRIFKRKHVSTTKDTAVTLLIDCSGSMSGSKIRLASQSAYALITAMERMNIKNEVLGFTTGETIEHLAEEKGYKIDNYNFWESRGRSLVTYVFKSFSERFVYGNKSRLVVASESNMSMWDNVDGESLMIAANRLLARNETRKILIVLSDGKPNSLGWVDFSKHLKDTVEFIETKTEIDIVGIGIDSQEVKKFYKDYVILNNVRDLPTTCLDKLQKILLK